MKHYDLVIIGAGITGASIARELSRYKLTIALLEKEEELSFGVSKSNSGIIHPGTQNPRLSLKGRLCFEGARLTPHLAGELGVDYKQVGELIVAFNEAERIRLSEIRKEAESLGVRRLRIVDKRWLRRHEPNLSPDVIAALYAPAAAVISPYRWVYDLSENALKNGVEIHTRTLVTGISRQSAQAAGFVIQTTRGEYSCRYLVNAAGLFADEIARMAGIQDINITPRKGQEFLLDKKRRNLTNHLIFPLPSRISKGVIVIKTSDGNPMIGPTAEECADKHDLSTSEEGRRSVFERARKMVPGIDENDVIAYFAGLRPACGDDFIIRHEDACRGMVTVAGIQSPGLTAAPAIARMVSAILKSGGLTLRRKLFFRRHRKRSIHLFFIPLSQAKRLIRADQSYGDIVCRCEMVSAQEIKDAMARGASTMDGIKFRTRAQAGRCHGSFCTTRIVKMLAQHTGRRVTEVTKRGSGSELVVEDRTDAQA